MWLICEAQRTNHHVTYMVHGSLIVSMQIPKIHMNYRKYHGRLLSGINDSLKLNEFEREGLFISITITSYSINEKLHQYNDVWLTSYLTTPSMAAGSLLRRRLSIGLGDSGDDSINGPGLPSPS